MGFNLGDIAIDRLQVGYVETLSGEALFTMTQLSEGSIEITSESKDVKDKDGTLIKRIYTNKSGTFSATNALLNTDILKEKSGRAETSGASNSVVMPKIIYVKKGDTVTLTDFVEGSVKINDKGANGKMGKAYEIDATAGAGKFSISSTGAVTFPTDAADGAKYVIKYDRTVKTDGIAIHNAADKFPRTVKITLKALCLDPCTVDTLRACYIVLPSFQISPDVTLSFNTEDGITFNGDLQVDYCSDEKCLYEFYMCEADEEDD